MGCHIQFLAVTSDINMISAVLIKEKSSKLCASGLYTQLAYHHCSPSQPMLLTYPWVYGLGTRMSKGMDGLQNTNEFTCAIACT